NPEEAVADTDVTAGDEDGEEDAEPVDETEAADVAPAAPPEEGIVTGVAGGDSRFQVLARLYSTRTKRGVTLKADLDEADPAVDSWRTVYGGADWHERETWEMY